MKEMSLDNFMRQVEQISRARSGYLELKRVNMSYEEARRQLANMHSITIGAASDTLAMLESLTKVYLDGSPNAPQESTDA